MLEADGLVARRAYEVMPPRVDYSLTPLGHEAAIHVGALARWVERKLPELLADQA